MDVKAVRALLDTAQSPTAYHITGNQMWQQVESIEGSGRRRRHVKVTMKTRITTPPRVCAFAIHPALEDVNLFNDGIDKPSTSTGPGPFKVVSGAPPGNTPWSKNDKWWGEKPVLNRIIWRQMDSDAIVQASRTAEPDAFVGCGSYTTLARRVRRAPRFARTRTPASTLFS